MSLIECPFKIKFSTEGWLATPAVSAADQSQAQTCMEQYIVTLLSDCKLCHLPLSEPHAQNMRSMTALLPSWAISAQRRRTRGT